MAINDTDKLLVNDGSKTETITIAQFKDRDVLNDTDRFLINDGLRTETITWAELSDELKPKGIVNTPTVLAPDDGAGSGALSYLKSDKITKVEGGGIISDGSTGTSQSNLKQFSNWDSGISGSAEITSNYPLSENDSDVYFTRFGGVRYSIPVPIPAGSVASIDANNEDFAGGHIYFYFSDGTSEKAAQSLPKVNSWSAGPFSTCSTVANASDRYLIGIEPKQDPHNPATRLTVGMKPLKIDGAFAGSDQPIVQIYDTTLTVAGPTDLALMSGSVFATDGTGAPGPYSQTPYKLTTTDIESVDDSDPANVVLTFTGDVSTNPDLQYFQAGDVVQGIDINAVSYDVFTPQNSSFPPSRNTSTYTYVGTTTIAEGSTNLSKSNVGFIFKMSTLVSDLHFGYLGNKSNYVGRLWGWTGNSSDNWEDLDCGEWSYNTSGDYLTSGPQAKYEYFAIAKLSESGNLTKCSGSPINSDNMSLANYGILQQQTQYKVISTDLASNTMTVDGGNWNDGDSVEYQTKGGNGTIVSVDTGSNTLKIANTSDRDERWIGPNQAGTDFAVAGPSVIDEPLLTTNVELESSQFATTPAGVDGLKEIIWRLNGVEQSAGTLNPYRPNNLLTNTTYTVEVQHVGNTLKEPSEWSTSTTFTTGASRSLKDHYMSRILELETALAEAKPKRGRKKKED